MRFVRAYLVLVLEGVGGSEGGERGEGAHAHANAQGTLKRPGVAAVFPGLCRALSAVFIWYNRPGRRGRHCTAVRSACCPVCIARMSISAALRPDPHMHVPVWSA